jgi:putative FmdB family regulatory protein
MPVYEYLCDECGTDFTALRRMSEASAPHDCPECGEPAHRAMLTAPAYAGMPATERKAHSINERARHEPKLSSQVGHVHGPGCGCGSGPSKSTKVAPDGKKSFPSKRPWMISH